MDNALSCLNNHKEGARLYTATYGLPYLACQLGQAEGVAIGSVLSEEPVSVHPDGEMKKENSTESEAESIDDKNNRYTEL